MADYALDDAAVAALWSLRQSPVERMGALYREGEGYARTPTIEGGGSHVKGTIRFPAGSLAALFHNHPATSSSRRDVYAKQFSDDDKAQARRLGVPSYILAGNRVMRYDPRSNTTEEVLAQFPIEEFLQFIAMKRSRENPIAAAIIAEQNSKPTRVASNGR